MSVCRYYQTVMMSMGYQVFLDRTPDHDHNPLLRDHTRNALIRLRSAAVPMAAAAVLLASACVRRALVLEVSGTVMYDKPRIESIAHTLTDARTEGGSVTVKIVMLGDPGLQASFDISPGIAERESMTESAAGHYEAEFVFPKNTVGGPFSIFGRVLHDKAGEVVLRDVQPITITLLER